MAGDRSYNLEDDDSIWTYPDHIERMPIVLNHTIHRINCNKKVTDVTKKDYRVIPDEYFKLTQVNKLMYNKVNKS